MIKTKPDVQYIVGIDEDGRELWKELETNELAAQAITRCTSCTSYPRCTSWCDWENGYTGIRRPGT